MNHTGWRKRWRIYGPTFQWRTFRLHGEPPNGRWMPLRVTQLVGGRTWSLSITRTGPVQDPPEDDGRTAAGLTAFVLLWDRGTEADPCAWVRATEAGAASARYAVMKEHWDSVAGYEEYPDTIPTDPVEAARVWDEAREEQADPEIGVFTVDMVVIGS